MSIIGPYTKKSRIESRENRFKKLRVIKASEVEQTENTKANSIIKIRETSALPPVMLKNSYGTATRIKAVIKAPSIKNGPAVKNSEQVSISKAYTFDCSCRSLLPVLPSPEVSD